MQAEDTIRKSIVLRPVQEDDEGFLFRVFSSTREAERDAAGWTNEEWDTFVQMQFEAQRRHYRVHYPSAEHSIILRDGQPVGRMWVHRSETEIRLLDIAVLPDHRRRGIGTHLIRNLQEEARTARAALRHSAEVDNPGARRLYERLGFTAAQTHGLHTLMEWNPTDDALAPSADH